MAAVAVAPGAAAQTPATEQASTLAPAADVLARRIADAWRPLQRSDGTFRDAVRDADPGPWRDPGGAGTLGAALMLHGLRTNSSWAVRSGLKAVESYARRPIKPGYKQVFQTLTLALAYDAGIRRLGGDARWRRVRPLLERRLRQVRFKVIGGGRAYYNYYLVEALGALLATEHPLRSRDPRSMLHDPAAARRRARRFLTYSLPGYALPDTTRFGAVPLTLLSDPPGNPPAYHAFSLGLLAQSLSLLGPRRSLADAHELLDRMARASWAFMAPDGDVSWFGRSQEQAWTLAMTAAGTAIAARLRDEEGIEAERMRSTGLRALDRMGRVHASRSFGVAITPGLAAGVTPRAVAGLDPYVTGTAYTGLTLLGLEWLLGDRSATQPFTVRPAGADADGAFRLARSGGFLTVRRGDVWFAVKREPGRKPRAGSDHSRDLRYDAGLNGLQVRGPGGDWADVLPPRPFTRADSGADAAGPVIARRGRERADGVPAIAVDRTTGRVTLVARPRRQPGALARRGGPTRFTPVACGVRIEVTANAGERWWYSVFFRGAPRVDGQAITDGRQRVTVSAPFRFALLGRYASGLDRALRRVRISVTAPVAGPLSFTVCREGMPSA